MPLTLEIQQQLRPVKVNKVENETEKEKRKNILQHLFAYEFLEPNRIIKFDQYKIYV